MRSFRTSMHRPLGRILTGGVLVATLHASAQPSNYLAAVQAAQQKEAKIREIAAKMNVDPEFLLNPGGRRSFDFRSLFNTVAAALGMRSEAVTANAQPESVRESIAKVKERYAIVAADTTLAKIAQLLEIAATPPSARANKKGQIRAELRSVLRLIDKDFLPPVKDGLPGSAKTRDADMRRAVKDLQKAVKDVLNAPGALDDANLDATLAKLRTEVSGMITLRNNGPRWTRDPFPVKDSYKAAPIKQAPQQYDAAQAPTAPPPTAITNAAAPKNLKPVSNAVAGEVAAMAASLGTPAKIFSWVHDRVEWESYSGVAKGALGTMKEGRGNDWDQALLLRDLLVAQGYQAQLEWGRVTMPIQKAMNLVGTEDPLQAGNLLATAGFDGMLLTRQNAPIAVQMTHVWVRAYIPYIPHRGAKAGTPDTWVRMDPSFKRYEYQPGIPINGKVAWNQDEYLNTSAIRPPSDFYGDKIWSYIRANNIDCVNLSQVAKLGRVKAENFPFVPSTLTTKIDEVRGLGAAPPADQVQSVTIDIVTATGAVVGTFTTAIADVWGKKLSLTFPPATPDDAAVIASYGGLFNTPPYLIRLKPVFSLDDQPVAEGIGIAAGAALDMDLTFRQPNVADDAAHHQVVAGETHALVLDAGAFPDSLVQSRIERLKALTAANANEDAIRSEQLHLVGLRYMQHVDDGIAFATGVRWQRAVKRVFEADVRRQIDITYNVAGAPMRLKPAENNIDVARLVVGIIPITSDQSNKAEALALAGLQSSYLEGSIWEEMNSMQGISAAKALLLSKAAGQQLHTVTQSNVDAVLAQTNLASDVEAEIRGSVAQGRIAKIPTSNITLGNWTGTGYILQDPRTGAATYPISGGLAGGSATDAKTAAALEAMGYEAWFKGSDIEPFLSEILSLAGVDSPKEQQAPSVTQSDPVNMASGNMFHVSSDFEFATLGPWIALLRTYNSRSEYNGPFGYGWTHTYGEMLVPNEDGSVTYRDPDGSEHVFAATETGFVSPAGKHLDLARSGSGWTLTFKSGLRQTYDARGNFVAQTDLHGNTVAISRDGDGNPTRVTDATGRTVLTFTITSGKITAVTDHGGRTVSYGYDGDNLATITDLVGKTWTYSYDLQHNLTSIRDPLGHINAYDYDSDDRLMRHVDANGAEESFQYDIAGRHSIVTDRRGGDRYIRFDDLGRATLEADPAGNVITAAFDADNNRSAVVDSRGFTTTYEYDANGNRTKQVTPDGSVTTSVYDAESRVLSSTDASGVVTSNTYDSSGNLTSSSRTINGVVETTTATFDSRGQMLTRTDPTGGTTTFEWNSDASLHARTGPAGDRVTFVVDPLGRATSFTDAAGHETKFTYDGRGRVVSTTDPHGNVASVVFDDAGRRVSMTTPRGTTRHTFDAEGRVLSTTDPAGGKIVNTYNAAGDLLTRTDVRGNVSRYEYDTAGRLLRAIDGSGHVWAYTYCNDLGGSGGAACSTCGTGFGSRFCEITDPSGKVTRQKFDSMGRVLAITDALGRTSTREYDGAGRVIASADPNGATTRFSYDSAGRLLSVRQANDAVTSYTYDRNGNRLTQTDANGHTWRYEYDVANRTTREIDPLDRATSYTYDAIGNLKTKTDAKGKTVTYEYDVRRLTAARYPDGRSDTFTYDGRGRRTAMSNANVTLSYTYDTLGRTASVKNDRYNVTVRYEYDLAGNRSKLITPQATVTYAYDAENHLVSMTDTLFGAFRFEYDDLGRRTEMAYPNGTVTTYAYDAAGQMTAIATKNATGAVVDAWSYQYDAAGYPLVRTDKDGRADMFRYDSVNRLTEATYADGERETFGYDGAGNRTRLSTPVETTQYTYDAANQLKRAGSDTFAYDLNGNLTSKTTPRGTTTFVYDFNDRIVNIAGPDGAESNVYAPDGSRVDLAGASIENGQVRVISDLQGNPILDWGTDSQTWTYRLYAPGVDQVVAEFRRINNRKTFLHHDALQSVTAVSDTSGAVAYRSTYRAFGAMTRTADPSGIVRTRLGFTGRELSIGTMQQYRSRFYDTSYGRFTAQDSMRGNAESPLSLNRYAYVLGAPTRWIDPTGEGDKFPFGKLRDLTCEGLVAALAWLVNDINKRIAEGENPKYDLPDFIPEAGKPGTKFGHALKIEAEQFLMALVAKRLFDDCTDFIGKVRWDDVAEAYLHNPLAPFVGKFEHALRNQVIRIWGIDIWWPGVAIAALAVALILFIIYGALLVAYLAEGAAVILGRVVWRIILYAF